MVRIVIQLIEFPRALPLRRGGLDVPGQRDRGLGGGSRKEREVLAVVPVGGPELVAEAAEHVHDSVVVESGGVDGLGVGGGGG